MSIDNYGTGRLPSETTLQNGRYIVVKQVGRGGMAAVYEATDTASRPHLRVAIKEMSQSKLEGREDIARAKERFREEAKMLRKLDHPNLPTVYNSFEEEGRLFLVMEFIDGQTLLELLQPSHDRPLTRPLPPQQVIDYACQLCDVLNYLHDSSRQIIYRDLKPSNVMVRTDGHVFLIDFGIARIYKAGQTHDTEAFASLGFTAPEQFRQAQTNPRSDLFSLGATLYCCLTAMDPAKNKPTLFDFQPARTYAPHVSVELEQLIHRLLERDEENRPASAAQVKARLLQIKQQLRSPNHPEPVRPLTIPVPLEPELPLPPKPVQEKIRLVGPDGKRPPANIHSLDTEAQKLPDPQTPLPVEPAPTPPVQPIAASTSSDIPQMVQKIGKVVLHAVASIADASGPLIKNVSTQLALRISHRRGNKKRLSSLLVQGLSIFLCVLLGLGVVVALFSLFHALQIAAVVVEFCLAFSLLLFATITSRKTQDPAPQSILSFTGLTMSVICLASLGQPPMQQFISTLTFGLLNSETTINQLAFAGLIVALLLLFIRYVCARLFDQPFTWTGRICVFMVAMVTALVQAAFWWNEPIDQSALSFVPPDISPTLMPVMIDGFRLLPLLVAATVAWGLFWAARIVLLRLIDQIPGRDSTIGEIVPKSPLRAKVAFGQESSLKAPIIPETTYASLKNAMIRIDRLIVLAVVLTTISLQFFFGEKVPLFARRFPIPYANVNDFHINWVVLLLLGVLLIGCLIVMWRPLKPDTSTSLPGLTGWNYFCVFILVVICICFLTWNTGISQYPPLYLRLQDASMLFPERITNAILSVGLIVTALVSLLWLSRPYFVEKDGTTTRKHPSVQRILGMLFGYTMMLALSSIVLSLLPPGELAQLMPHHTVPIVLSSALILLLLGVLMAVWAENRFKVDAQK